MSSTHNHCFSHHHYQAWCHQIFFVNNTKIFVTSSVLKLQKWFLHQNGVESNQESKSDMYKLLGGVWRCVSYQKMCSRWLLAWYCHLAWLDIVANCALLSAGVSVSALRCTWLHLIDHPHADRPPKWYLLHPRWRCAAYPTRGWAAFRHWGLGLTGLSSESTKRSKRLFLLFTPQRLWFYTHESSQSSGILHAYLSMLNTIL